MAAVTQGEMYGYPKEVITPFGFSAVRQILVSKANASTRITEFLTYPGELYPYEPNHGARATRVSTEPFALQAQSTVNYEMADWNDTLLTIQYGVPIDDALESTTLHNPASSTSETVEPFSESATLQYTAFGWTGDTYKRNLEPDEAPVFTLPRMRYKLTRHNQPSIPAASGTLVGKINNATVTPLLFNGVTFLAQTLFMESPSFSASFASDGTRGYSVTYSMVWHQETWRKTWNARGGEFTSLVYLDGGDAYEFPEEADFSVIFP